MEITGGQTQAFTVTATRLTPNCSGTVNIIPTHPADDVSAHSFSWEPSDGASLMLTQSNDVATSEYRITPSIESDSEYNATQFSVTVNSNTAGVLNELVTE
jgi:hypothetical protein